MGPRTKLHGCLKGFLVTVGAVILLGMFLNWLVNESVWKAEAIRDQIHVGMSVLDIDPILSKAEGFRHCTYLVQVGGEWKEVSHEELANDLQTHEPDPPQGTRLEVMVSGFLIPARFLIDADAAGRVVSVTHPRTRS